MIPIVYVTLLFLMLFVLYRCGKEIEKSGNIWSAAGITAMLVYTLNVGLRFGRGIDYNEYWRTYEEIARGFESNRDVVFVAFVKFLAHIGMPYQVLILLCSFLFILGVLLVLRNYRVFISYALPLFALFSISAVENMIRFFMGFSFILIGFSFLLQRKKWKYVIFGMIGCSIHLALLPLMLAFWLVLLYKRPLLYPIIAIVFFFVIGFSFKTETMTLFADLIQTIALLSSSERFESYSNNADFWLTGGFSGRETNVFPPASEIVFLCFLVWYGYKGLKKTGCEQKDVIVYNLFLIGFLLKPIANQIELLMRFDHAFFFFRAVVCAKILSDLFRQKVLRYTPLTFVYMLSFFYVGFSFFKTPFQKNPQQFLYVWNHDNQTYNSMLRMWNSENDKESSQIKKIKKRKN